VKRPDLLVLWWRAPATGVGWFPIVLDDDEEAQKKKLHRRFHGKGGVETFVSSYRLIPASKTVAPNPRWRKLT